MPSPEQRLALLQLAEAAAAAAPANPRLQVALAKALIDVGETHEAIRRLGQGGIGSAGEAIVRAELARACGLIGDVDSALEVVRDWPDSAWGPKLALKLLTKHGRMAEAGAYEEAVAAQDPSDPSLIECRARRLRADPEALLRLCDEALAHGPGTTQAIYYRAIALAQLGRGDEAAATMGLDRFLAIAPLPAPDGFGRPEAFRAAVRDEILANPTLHADPAGHATRRGLRTGTYPQRGDLASIALVRSIREAISAYADALTGEHPFVGAKPARATFIPWALVFREAGHQVLHHHPEPWLTGVYYVSAPEASPRPGAIRIGVLPEWAGVEPPWPVRTVEPEPGTLILFPSFVPHDTVPTGSAEERISLAFDVNRAPAEASSR